MPETVCLRLKVGLPETVLLPEAAFVYEMVLGLSAASATLQPF